MINFLIGFLVGVAITLIALMIGLKRLWKEDETQ